ncbi:MAG TPA: nodulation protein NfeD [Thermoanaerobaculia bacterium]|jgi:membrane-bound serine protease (ClpP class)|nr:nodulation protein NfeD [Thermoanaerobaculia bacterium]
MLHHSTPTRASRTAALACLALGLLGLLTPLVAAAPAAGSGEVLVVRVKSAIQPVSAELITDAVAEADRTGAAALIIELDTAGGLMTSTRDITTAILGARTPVAVYVAPSGAQAASAGFFILMSADVAAMAPGTNAGAAHPVGGQGDDIPGVLGQKVEQDAAANIRSLAARNGRNAALAEEAVVKSRSFTAHEALEGKLIDVVAPNLGSLVRALDGRTVKRGEAVATVRTAGAEVRRFKVSPLRELLGVLADPNVAYLLFGLGWLGLLFELMHPGAVLPGVVGAICLILGFYGLSVLPVNYAGLALIFLAVIFFILEIKVTSYGMLTVAGVISLVLGSLMLFKTPEPALRVSVELIAMLATFSLLVVGFLAFMALRAQRAPVRTGIEGLVHEVGIARTPLSPRGKIFVHGEIWDAVSDEPVAAGEPVEIMAVRNMTLGVRRRQDLIV